MSLRRIRSRLKRVRQSLQPYLDRWLPIFPIPRKRRTTPTGSYVSLQDWFRRPKLTAWRSQQRYEQIYAPEPIVRDLPKTLDRELHWQFQIDYPNRSEPGFVATVPYGRFWNNSAVVTPDNRLAADVSLYFKIDPRITPNKHPIFWKDTSLSEFVNGKVAVFSAPGGNTYFHWLFDVLPRIRLLQQSSIDLEEIDLFIVNDFRLPFQQQTLELLDIPAHKVICGSDRPHICAKELIVPAFPRHRTCQMGSWVYSAIRQTFLGQFSRSNLPQSKRLFISRANASRRRMTNEVEVLDYLEPWGFQKVELEALSVVEQAKLFAQAEWVVAPHGAGLTNIVFCSPGTKVVEIYSPNYVSISYWNISTQIGLDYYYMFGEGKRPAPFTDPHGLKEDITVNLAELQLLLSQAGLSGRLTAV